MFEDDDFRDVLPYVFENLDCHALPNLCKVNTYIQFQIKKHGSRIHNIVIQKKTDLFIQKHPNKSQQKIIFNSIKFHDIEIYYELTLKRFVHEIAWVSITAIIRKANKYKFLQPFRLIEFMTRQDLYDTVQCNHLFYLALESKDDKLIHFVMNLKLFDPSYKNYSSVKSALVYHNMVVFNLLVKGLNLSNEIVLSIVSTDFLSNKRAKVKRNLDPTDQIEYFDPTRRRTLEVSVKRFDMLKYSESYSDLKAQMSGNVMIPFPVETHVMKCFVDQISTGFVRIMNETGENTYCGKSFKTLDDFNSFLRLISFFEIDFE